MCALKRYIRITRNELTYLIARKNAFSFLNLNNILSGSFLLFLYLDPRNST